MEKKNIIQSGKVTALRGSMTTQQVRILAKLVERCQPTINAQGDSLRTLVKKGKLDAPTMCTFAFTSKELTGTQSHNRKGLRAAIEGLQKQIIQYYDYDAKVWHSAPLISEATIEDGTGRTILTCPEWLLCYICDFTKGATVYDIVRAFRLRKASSVRLYMLLSHATASLTFTITQLRKWLGADSKYNQTRDFIKRCIEPARLEMETTGCNGFSYSLNRDGDGNRAKVTSITFTPIKREEDTDAELMAKISASNLIPKLFYDYLLTQLGYTSQEIGSNKAKLIAFTHLDGWEEKFTAIVDRARRKRKGKAYIMAAIRNEAKGA